MRIYFLFLSLNPWQA